MSFPQALAASDIVVNNSSEVIAIIPALPAGACRVRIVTQYALGKPLKVPHTCRLIKN
ncbi:MAG: DUF4469 domain-containing protein [Treponema sp.]|nr:DUF4469 domain-containing protein [Treponema sp.]